MARPQWQNPSDEGLLPPGVVRRVPEPTSPPTPLAKGLLMPTQSQASSPEVPPGSAARCWVAGEEDTPSWAAFQ